MSGRIDDYLDFDLDHICKCVAGSLDDTAFTTSFCQDIKHAKKVFDETRPNGTPEQFAVYMFVVGGLVMNELGIVDKKLKNKILSEKMSSLTPEQALDAVEICEGNKSAAARMLNCNIKTLNRALEKLKK